MASNTQAQPGALTFGEVPLGYSVRLDGSSRHPPLRPQVLSGFFVGLALGIAKIIATDGATKTVRLILEW